MLLLKNRLLAILLLLSIYICIGPFQSASAEKVSQIEGPILQFPVLSDIHISGESEREKFIRALTDYQRIAPNYQAIVMVGDLTNSGAETEYDSFNRIVNSYINTSTEKLMTIGNHEYMEGQFAPQGLDEELYRKRFLNKTGMPGIESQVYFDKWVEGYHFIAMGTEGYLTPDENDHAEISEEQYTWLENKLAENADSAKPIFVFLHQPIDQTVYGSEEWGAGFTDTRLKGILNQYPQVILFSGHSHYLLNHPRTIFQDGFTMVNTGSVAYSYSDLGYNQLSQGLLVNVYPDRIEIKARDFTNNTWIQTFQVKTPYEKTNKDISKPFFTLGSMVEIKENEKGNHVTLSWDAALDNTLVDKYVIKQDGKVVQTIHTKFWENGELKQVEGEIPNLTPNTEYNFKLFAVDAWNNESLNALPISFKTSTAVGWIMVDGEWRFYEGGKSVTGWKFIEGHWYLFLNDGKIHTGWYSDGSQSYYLNKSGYMEIGWKVIDGKSYYFELNGALKTGWIFESNKWYYLNSDWTPKFGWFRDGEKWYFLKSDGMKTGWEKVDNKWYFFNSSGMMQTGWILSNGIWYYLDNNGIMKTGWVLVGNKWYYLESSGGMKIGWLLEKGKWYYLMSDGRMQTGWEKINHVWYYFLSNGVLT